MYKPIFKERIYETSELVDVSFTIPVLDYSPYINLSNIDIDPGYLKEVKPSLVQWRGLCSNDNFEAITFIEQNLDSEELDWMILSGNENAIHILEKHLDKVDWSVLSHNRKAIRILERNLDKVDWRGLSANTEAIHILEQNLNKIDWCILSGNENAIHLLEKHLEEHPDETDELDWILLSRNKNAIRILEKNLHRVNWNELSGNENAIPILEKNLHRVDWHILSFNESALHIIEQNLDKVCWANLAFNKNAFHIFEQIYLNKVDFSSPVWGKINPVMFNNIQERLNDFIDWEGLLLKEHAVHFIEEHAYIIDCEILSYNRAAVHFLETNLDKVCPDALSGNSNATHLLFSLDYEKMKENNKEFFEDLVGKVFHPKRIERLSSLYDFEFSDYMENVI
jgi:hypothetical protein